MAGAVTALIGRIAAASGGVVPSPTPNWTNIYDTDVGSTNLQTISGISSSISISVTATGSGIVYYTFGAGEFPYTGAFPVSVGQPLGFIVFATIGGGTVAGALTVKNDSNGSVTLDTITYAVYDSGGV